MLIHKIFVFTTVFVPWIASMSYIIPPHLLNCYRTNTTRVLEQIGAPYTMELLIELIRKVELYPGRITDLNVLSTSMLHSLKFDGIQRSTDMVETGGIVPVGPSAMHFTLYKILLDYLIPGEASQFPIEALSETEMCTLHLMLSSSVQAWQRGDEAKTCPVQRNLPSNRQALFAEGKEKSTCPIERGVVQSSWGSLSPGHVLAAVAAALHRQDIKLKRLIKDFDSNEVEHVTNLTKKFRNEYTGDVNNVWAATIAGDLAEVIIHQAFRTTRWVFGTAGAWDDNTLPTNYYLPDSIEFHWEMTLAETLGGIDGAVIASMVDTWFKNMGRLHLSQILDMYYSRKGMSFDNTYRACQRKDKFVDLLTNVDMVEQITNMAKFLQRARSNMFLLEDQQIQQLSENVYRQFQENIDSFTDFYSGCEQKLYEVTPMDIIAIIDGSWNETEGKKLVTALTRVTDISFYGSKIGLINGNNGEWLTNITNSVHQIFQDLAETKAWPTSLSLSHCLKTVVDHLERKHKKECTDNVRSTRPNVVLVLAGNSAIGSIDFNNSRSLVRTVKSINPSISLLYAASEATADLYQQLAINEYMNDAVVRTGTNPRQVAQDVYEKLAQIPGQILELHCDVNRMEYEDYITPGVKKTYQIPYSFIQSMDIKVEFKGNDYGDLLICGNDKENPSSSVCKTVSQEGTAEFIARHLCDHNTACNAQFTVEVTNSLLRCTENDCRYPDQARLSVRTSWTSAAAGQSQVQLVAVLAAAALLAATAL